MEFITRQRMLAAGSLLVLGSLTLGCSSEDGEASAAPAGAKENGAGQAIEFGDDLVENNVMAACDGTTRVYMDIGGSGGIEVVPDSSNCADKEPISEDVRITFGDDEIDNNLVAGCDGTTRLYRMERPEAHSIPRDVVAVADSPNCT